MLCALGGIGLLASSVIVAAGGRIGPVAHTVPLSSWFGLLARRTVDPRRDAVPGAALAGAILVLVAAWLVTISWSRRRELPSAWLWLLGGCWALPLVIGPPMLSNDVFSYAAQGMLGIHGHSPYATTPSIVVREWVRRSRRSIRSGCSSTAPTARWRR